MRNATRAVASFSRLSPSSSVVRCGGTPRRRKTAVAATGSVGATIAPSTNAACHDMPSISV
jgi:hypothetical protein